MFNCYFPEFRFGFANLKKSLDSRNDVVLTIAEDLQLSNDDRRKIILADNGGINPSYFLLEYLKMHQSDLTVEKFRKRLVHHNCDDAKAFLDKYETEMMFKEISDKDTRELGFKLILPTGSNITIWKDLASDFNISQAYVSKIDFARLQPGLFSQTEKLFEIISIRFPRYTIGEFREKLKSLNLMDAYKLMEEKIIEEIKEK